MARTQGAVISGCKHHVSLLPFSVYAMMRKGWGNSLPNYEPLANRYNAFFMFHVPNTMINLWLVTNMIGFWGVWFYWQWWNISEIEEDSILSVTPDSLPVSEKLQKWLLCSQNPRVPWVAFTDFWRGRGETLIILPNCTPPPGQLHSYSFNILDFI